MVKMLKDIVGIILKERDYAESSKILDVFTKEYGIIGVISKGSKKMKSILNGVSTRLTYGVFHIYYKENKLSTLVSVDVIDPFIKIRSDINDIGYVTYLSELTLQVVKQTHNIEDVFNLFINGLVKINKGYDPLVITNIIELKYLDYLGVGPILDKCSCCSRIDNIITLSSSKNGLICKKCRTYEKIVDIKTIKFIRMYYYLDISKISKIDMDAKVKNEIDDFLTEYYSIHTGLYLNSKDFINNLKKLNVYV